jgi:hypothetical protein
MEQQTSHQLALAQVRFEDVVDPTPAYLFTSEGRAFFQVVGTNGSIVAPRASFVFWKKGKSTPSFFSNRLGSFPDVEGVSKFDDGTLMLTMFFSPSEFSNPKGMVEKLRSGLREMEQTAGDEWLQ